jgi:hypothetical protein
MTAVIEETAGYTGEIVTDKGDVVIRWDKADDEQVARAAEAFAAAARSSVLCAPRGEASEQVRQFDPEADLIVQVSPLQGG